MTKVCSECVGENFLNEQITLIGEDEYCDFCESDDNPTIELSDLAEQVHSVLGEHFYMTSPEPEGIDIFAAREGYWEQPGQPVTYTIMDLIDSSEKVAESIREYLSEKYDPYGKDATIDPSPYADDSHYEERPIDTYEFQESWASFRNEILSRSRFFNEAAKSALEHIFQGIDQLKTRTNDPVVRVYGPADNLFRARMAKTDQELEDILKTAPISLGAPLGQFASAGRMNAEGISVFYGATDVKTCIAEIRAPVGSYVISGRFNPLKNLRLLDLTRLKKVYLHGSFFDSEHTKSMQRVHFLKRLETELSQPVLPGSESRNYLPTQIVAEYLAGNPDMKLDGIVFSSSQTSTNEIENADEDGKNVVLFSHASGLERYELPAGSIIDVSQYSGDPDDPDFSITVWEMVPDTKSQDDKTPQTGLDIWPYSMAHAPDFIYEEHDPSIKLDMDSIEVRRVEGVSYSTFSFDVSRYRSSAKNLKF